ncbi:MAG: 3-hexulose-6-phosphate synthase [Erysipelotrichaceae bacterium]|nr:3-hexulose-6-phosphate synthase [Erysipelotrichaceae bacterium]
MKLQLAIDDLTLEEAIELVKKVHDSIDIIECGTPFIYEYGMNGVRTMKREFPDKEILADLKIMDAGYYEAEQALKAGADYVTILGVTDNLTVKGCVDACNAYGKQCVVDMICVDDLPTRIAKMEEIGAHFVSVHVGVDQQTLGRKPIDDLRVMKEAVKTASISVAGGINEHTLADYIALQPEILIIGSGITHSKDPVQSALTVHKAIKGN